jgi:hypothetical protein
MPITCMYTSLYLYTNFFIYRRKIRLNVVCTCFSFISFIQIPEHDCIQRKNYNFYSDTNRIIQQRRAAARRITAASSSGTRQAKVKASNVMLRPCSVLSKVNITLTWLWWPHYQLHSSPTHTVKHHHLHIPQTRCIH